MREKINEEVSVIMYYSSQKRLAMPQLMSWQNKDYPMDKIDYVHPVKDGTVCITYSRSWTKKSL